MTISFDLDDTLIPSAKRFETEPQNFLHRILRIEKVRVGTIELMKELKSRKYKIYIYTTSLRSPTKIWWTFYLHGLTFDKIINQKLHEATLGNQSGNYSKYPPAFNIDIHIDDSIGVQLEGKRHNFKTIIVKETDSFWTNTVLKEIDIFEKVDNRTA